MKSSVNAQMKPDSWWHISDLFGGRQRNKDLEWPRAAQQLLIMDHVFHIYWRQKLKVQFAKVLSADEKML